MFYNVGNLTFKRVPSEDSSLGTFWIAKDADNVDSDQTARCTVHKVRFLTSVSITSA